jgi:hypothetical protein
MQKQEITPKLCNLCGCSSDETAIFSTTYAKGTLNICLECLAQGVVEITKQLKQDAEVPAKQEFEVPYAEMQKLPPEFFEIKDEVYGFPCEKCGSVMFSDSFPAQCGCGHMNAEHVLQNLK